MPAPLQLNLFGDIMVTNKIVIIQFLLIVALFLSACETAPEPLASFEIDKAAAKMGETITFSNSSQHASNFDWDFGDGHSSKEENPAHAYSGARIYTATLTASGEGGTASASESLIIWDLALEGTFYGDSVSFQGQATFKTQPVRLDLINMSSDLAVVNLVMHTNSLPHEEMKNEFPGGVSCGHHPEGTTEVKGVYGHAGPGGVLSWFGNLSPGLYTFVAGPNDPLCVWYIAGLTVSSD